MPPILPVILAGGVGSRLWPLSEKGYPKQFSTIVGQENFLRKTIRRLTSSSFVSFEPPIIITNIDYKPLFAREMKDVVDGLGTLMFEPEGKNTAPAILAACLTAYQSNRDTTLLVSPSDHYIDPVIDFHKSIKDAGEVVDLEKIVTFGVLPTSAETGYGYLELDTLNNFSEGIFKVNRFVEKPNIELAKFMIGSGKYYWNSGVFMFKAETMISAFKKLLPEVYSIVKNLHF